MSFLPRIFNFLRRNFGEGIINYFWKFFWKIEEVKEERELGVKSRIPIRGSERATLLETILNNAEGRILEVGFGYGQNIPVLRRFVSKDKLLLLELDLDRILATKGAQGDFNFINGNIKDLPFRDNSIDTVFTSAVLLYLDSSEIDKALDELFRVAKRRVVFLEQETKGKDQSLSGGVVGGSYWIRNYQAIIKQKFPEAALREIKIQNPRWPVESWEALGVVLEVFKGER